jgi:5-carboxymethyl-2-hydroxymuconate isomerase
MKLISFERNGEPRFGAVVGDGVIDLTARTKTASVRRALEQDALRDIARVVATATPDFGLAEIRYLIPVPDAEKIVCVGVNYGDRNAEYKDGSAQAEYPSIFIRFARSFTGHLQPLVRPPESAQLDYEGEIAIVIGRSGRRIPESQAEAHIAGVTCANEGTMRDWLRKGKFNVTQGKNWDASGAIGPWLVTSDELPPYDALHVRTRVNGELRQDDTTANLMFPFRYLIHYISTWTTLAVGDIILTGTPVGAGVRFDPPRFLTAGDRVDVDVSGVGTLSNPVADESR